MTGHTDAELSTHKLVPYGTGRKQKITKSVNAPQKLFFPKYVLVYAQWREREPLQHCNATVLLYMRRVAHNLKKVALRDDVSVIFFAPNKLMGLVPRSKSKLKTTQTNEEKAGFGILHCKPFVDCVTNVVF